MGATQAAAGPPQRGPRRWRLIIAKGAGAALLLMLVLSLGWVTRPDQVARLILDRVGNTLGLDISSSGTAEYRVRGTPRLVVRDLVARQPGADAALLTADRVYLSLPWSTVRSMGSGAPDQDLTVQRVELDAPRLDLGALQRWRDSRPPAAAEVHIPTLVDGVRIVGGSVVGDGWSIDQVSLDLPSLHPRQAVGARWGGRFVNGDTSVPFDLQVALTRPALDAGFGVAGIATVATPDWRMPMQLRGSGRLLDPGEGLGLDGFRLGAHARYLGADRELPFVYGIAGPLRYSDGRLLVAPVGVVLRGGGVVPNLEARGAFARDDMLALELAGALDNWPAAWPALPPPLAQTDPPLPFALVYRGPANLSGSTDLQLRRGDARFDAHFRLPRVLDWLDQLETGTPLPPLAGRLSTPRLEISGATLEGVEIRFDDGMAEP